MCWVGDPGVEGSNLPLGISTNKKIKMEETPEEIWKSMYPEMFVDNRDSLPNVKETEEA